MDSLVNKVTRYASIRTISTTRFRMLLLISLYCLLSILSRADAFHAFVLRRRDIACRPFGFAARPMNEDKKWTNSSQNQPPAAEEEFFANVEEWLRANPVNNRDPLLGHTLEDLEEFVEKHEKNNATKLFVDDSDEEDTGDAPWLDPDLYIELESQQKMEYESFIMDRKYNRALEDYVESQSPMSPHYGYANSADWDALWDLDRNKGLNASIRYDPDVAEDLHQQVFAEEEGFLNNSAIFREALMDPSLANAAAAKRHNTAFQQQQRDIFQNLKREMDAFDRIRATTPRCTRCGCLMLEEHQSKTNPLICRLCEADRNEQRNIAETEEKLNKITELKKELSPWTGVIDPDTKEVFYWNQETNKMTWERPESLD